MNLFVRNLNFVTTQDTLRTAFEKYGAVIEVSLPRSFQDVEKNRGFGFVQAVDREAGMKMVAEMNGAIVDGRKIEVVEARPRTTEDRPWRKSSEV